MRKILEILRGRITSSQTRLARFGLLIRFDRTLCWPVKANQQVFIWFNTVSFGPSLML